MTDERSLLRTHSSVEWAGQGLAIRQNVANSHLRRTKKKSQNNSITGVEYWEFFGLFQTPRIELTVLLKK